MAGLLDVFNTFEGQQALGLLAAAGPRSDGAGFGQRLAEGLGSADKWRNRQSAENRMQVQDQMMQMQMDEARQKMAVERQMRELSAKFLTPAQPGVSPLDGNPDLGIMPSKGSAAVPAGFDYQGYSQAMAGIDPMKALSLQQMLQKDDTPIQLKEGESLYSGKASGYKPLLSIPKTPNLPSAVQEYQFSKQQGYPGSFLEFQLAQKKAGATNVNNTVSVAGPENEYNKTIGKTLADESTALVSAAKSAPMVVQNARMIKSALDQGAITGTGAETRLAIQKAAETLGLTQPGTAATTQQLVSGLSTLTLGSIKTSGLGGGNGFTNADREFLNSAISGNIADTPDNLRRVADLSERAAVATHAKGAKVLERWKSNPSLGAVAQDSQLDPIAASTPSATKPQGRVIDSLPTPNAGNKGQRIRDTSTGKILVSNGLQWRAE